MKMVPTVMNRVELNPMRERSFPIGIPAHSQERFTPQPITIPPIGLITARAAISVIEKGYDLTCRFISTTSSIGLRGRGDLTAEDAL